MKLPTKLYHYSKEPIDQLKQYFHSEEFITYQLLSKMKPCGFWFSVEDFPDDETWLTWCKGEEFRLECLKYKYHIKLKYNAKILHIKTSKELIEFGMKYQGNFQIQFDEYMDSIGRKSYPYIYQINWETTQEKYDGIIIAPYQYNCIMKSETSWYYGWDCASGCIWNMDCIEGFTLESILEEISESQEEENETDSHIESLAHLS